jgi:dihydropyrimidine dehydrogenase (NAD+) subunit PreA
MKANLAVNFCGVHFVNPFVLAASPSTDTAEMVARGFDAGWAGAVLKTTATEDEEVSIAYPIMSSLNRDGQMIGLHNIDLISERHIGIMTDYVRQLKREYPERVVIGSIVGRNKAEWQFLAREMAEAGADLIECSLSCPQGSMLISPLRGIEGEEAPLGSMVSQDPRLTEKVSRWIKEAVPQTPVYVKLTSGVTDLSLIARAVQASGADGLCLIDSVEGIVGIDLETLEPLPSVQGYTSRGGFTGRAIKPIGLRCVADAAQATSLPIAGVGGIYDWRDAAEYLLLGATIVQVCTAVMELGFGIAEELSDGLSRWLAHKGFTSIHQVVGLCLPRLVEHDALPHGINVRAQIDLTRCIGCGRCYVACRDGGHGAIVWNKSHTPFPTGMLNYGALHPPPGTPRGDALERQPVVDEDKCVGCGLCPQVCPVPGCITIKRCIPSHGDADL